ncbi:SAM domain-containing protein [Reticulomyxa filosa]|uniref:SAM domain-containing protein n=1 Tax=Reticulomyxa filosa TaxID=46433 RepID=X6N999_RETFI|nr:SAM domain-containing protein [Reticulomyxa filosa]|eukprot:ETO22478.1 SAM domain-containing protein [Reticulomyxa filosa]
MGCNQSADNSNSNNNNNKNNNDKQAKKNPLEIMNDYFELEKELGRGGSCRVLRVCKKKTGAKYAMKELVRNDVWNPILFRQEINILTTLTHPNVLSHTDNKIKSNNEKKLRRSICRQRAFLHLHSTLYWRRAPRLSLSLQKKKVILCMMCYSDDLPKKKKTPYTYI